MIWVTYMIISRGWDGNASHITCAVHDDVIKWKHFPHNWPFVRGIHRSRWIPHTRPVTRSFDVSFDLRLNKRLRKQPWGWWFEMPPCSLWRHCNDMKISRGWHGNASHITCTVAGGEFRSSVVDLRFNTINHYCFSKYRYIFVFHNSLTLKWHTAPHGPWPETHNKIEENISRHPSQKFWDREMVMIVIIVFLKIDVERRCVMTIMKTISMLVLYGDIYNCDGYFNYWNNVDDNMILLM